MSKNKIGYKSCDNGSVIVKLEILGSNNEERKVYNKRYAKYRTKRVRTIGFYDIYRNKMKIISTRSTGFSSSETYFINREIYINDYDHCIDNVCSMGIHYFKTFDAARQYALKQRFYTKIHPYCNVKFSDYSDNGILLKIFDSRIDEWLHIYHPDTYLLMKSINNHFEHIYTYKDNVIEYIHVIKNGKSHYVFRQ